MSQTPPDAVVRNIRNQIILCKRCPLHKEVRSPVPFSGPISAPIAILGEAPGYKEDQENTPFVGPAGTLLKDALREVGINPNDCLYFNTVCCYPSRTPNNMEVEACHVNLISQLSIIRSKYLLVLGNVALHKFRPDLNITQARGKPFKREGRTCFPTFHPAACLRQQQYARQFRDDLWKFKVLMSKDRVHGSK